jgi:hypothetical protein
MQSFNLCCALLKCFSQTHFDAIETKVRGFVSARFGDVSERTFHVRTTVSTTGFS